MALEASRIWVKAPDSVLTVGLHWEDVIDRGDTLASVSWTVPAGLTKLSESINGEAVTDAGVVYPAGEVALIRLSGGIADTDYVIRCTVMTGVGDTDQRSIIVAVRNR